jgi:predicted ATP-dependent endonuclease of OLD family
MISFKGIEIKGFRGFKNSSIELKTPNGELGSGLNIFVGENGSGKTTILKAISHLTINSFSGQNRVSAFDFNNEDNPDVIEIKGTLENQVDYSMPAPFKRDLQITEFKVEIKNRNRKSPNKLFSPTYSISNILEPTTRTPTWSKSAISDFYLTFDNDRFKSGEGLYIFYFDEERNKQTKKGFSTTFNKLSEDFNWRFLKDADQEEVYKKWKDYADLVIKEDSFKDVKKFFSEKFNRQELDGLGLELINLKEPFNESFLAVSGENNLCQTPLAHLGSGIELLFSILYLKEIASQSNGTIIYCIDEPELSLHPQWQKVFFEILKEEARTQQIFIATHSSHFIDGLMLSNVKKFSRVSGENKICQLESEFANDIKVKKLFSLENREIFFSKGVVLVEGIDDKNRIKSFLQNENIDLFIMDGLQNFTRAKDVCSQLGISFKCMVDLDFLRKYPELLPTLTQVELEFLDECKTLSSMEQTATDPKIIKEIGKIKKAIIDNGLKSLSSKIKLKMSSDIDYKAAVLSKIAELTAQGVCVLSNGVIEDYLDENGTLLDEGLREELISIVSI